jgi:ferric-dicitrate binding protein FerR (iron transport regulator)
MEQKYTDDTFLARWLNKDLTEQEHIAFEKTEEYKEYAKIIEKSDLFEAPIFNQEETFNKIQNKIKSQQKVRKLVLNRIYSIAASVALLFGIFYFIGKDTVYETSYGEQLAVVLPDGSKVQLNAKSKISFDKRDWQKGKRNVTLNGEGYFKVQKGSKFTVETELGSVSVLGTQFNVKRTQGYFDVKCFEGSVRFKDASDEIILTPGKGYQKIKGAVGKNTVFETISPSWISGESSFVETPLAYVVKELEKQYKVSIETGSVNMNQLFTGSFSNKNRDVALKSVFIPLQIVVTIDESDKLILSEK